MTEPDLERPFRAPLAAPLIGAPLVIGVWILAVVTHPGARYAGPAWLALGVVVYLLVRRRERSGLLHEVNVIEELPPGAQFRRLLVPMKLGPIGEEMVATAVALAKERDARVDALFVIVVPLEYAIDAPLCDLRGAGCGLARRGRAARRRERRARRADHGAGAGDRPGDSRSRLWSAEVGSDRARLLAALAPPVRLLLADRRLRAPQRTVRGARRRLSPGCPRGRILKA